MEINLTKYNIPADDLEMLSMHYLLRSNGAFGMVYNKLNKTTSCVKVKITFWSYYNDNAYDLDKLEAELLSETNEVIEVIKLNSNYFEVPSAGDNEYSSYIINKNMF